MPSNKPPTIAVSVATPPSPTPGFGSGGGFGAALTGHINDPTNAHPASAISYAGGPQWADFTTNPATDTESQLDKIITDLATGAGAAKIRYNGSGNDFADGTGLTATNLELVLDTLVQKIGSTASSDSGAHKMGVAATTVAPISLPADMLYDRLAALQDCANIKFAGGNGQWFDGTDQISGNVQDTIDDILLTLGTGLVGNSGAQKVGVQFRTAWFDGTSNPLNSVYHALDKIITDLNLQTVNFSGAHKIGIDSRPNWLDGTTNVQNSVANAIDKIITDLSDQVGATSDGASRIGAAAVGDLSMGSVRSQLNELDTEWGRYDRLNTWTAPNFFEENTRMGEGMEVGATEANSARLEMFRHNQQAAASRSHMIHFRRSVAEAGGTDIYNFSLWRDKGNGVGVEHLQLTSNAIYSNNTALWSHEQNNNHSVMFDMDHFQAGLYYRASGAGTWGHASWIERFRWDLINSFEDVNDGSIRWTGTTTGSGGANPPNTTGITNQMRAKNIVKGWGYFIALAPGSPTVANGFNVASLSFSGQELLVTIADNMADSDYVVCGLANTTGAFHFTAISPNTGSFQIARFESDTGTQTDLSATVWTIGIMWIGQQNS